MSLINDILGLSGAQRNNATDGAKKNDNVRFTKDDKSPKVVKTEISSAARHLFELKSEAKQYLDTVKSATTLSTEEIDQIKERLTSQYYFDSQVIDQIVEKMLRTIKINKLR